MPKTSLRSDKSEASVTLIKDSARVIILLRLTSDGHKASHGLYARAELLVIIYCGSFRWCVRLSTSKVCFFLEIVMIF